LSVKQDDLLRQALRGVEVQLFRAAHVLGFAALMDFLEEKIAKDNFVGLNGIRPNWRINSIEDLRDVGSDYQIIEAVRALGFCTKTEEKALKGLLNRRNECAHPTDYYPEINQTLGYLTELIKRIEAFQKRW
jgi:hypothetical protein